MSWVLSPALSWQLREFNHQVRSCTKNKCYYPMLAFSYFFPNSEQTEDQIPTKSKRLMVEDTPFYIWMFIHVDTWLDSTAESGFPAVTLHLPSSRVSFWGNSSLLIGQNTKKCKQGKRFHNENTVQFSLCPFLSPLLIFLSTPKPVLVFLLLV